MPRSAGFQNLRLRSTLCSCVSVSVSMSVSVDKVAFCVQVGGPSVCVVLCVYVGGCVWVWVSICLSPYICLRVHLDMYMSVCLSVCLSVKEYAPASEQRLNISLIM
jgi:hypothetical protein